MTIPHFVSDKQAALSGSVHCRAIAVCMISCLEMHKASLYVDLLLLGVHEGNLLINACIILTNSGSSNPFQGDEEGALFNSYCY